MIECTILDLFSLLIVSLSAKLRLTAHLFRLTPARSSSCRFSWRLLRSSASSCLRLASCHAFCTSPARSSSPILFAIYSHAPTRSLLPYTDIPTKHCRPQQTLQLSSCVIFERVPAILSSSHVLIIISTEHIAGLALAGSLYLSVCCMVNSAEISAGHSASSRAKLLSAPGPKAWELESCSTSRPVCRDFSWARCASRKKVCVCRCARSRETVAAR